MSKELGEGIFLSINIPDFCFYSLSHLRSFSSSYGEVSVSSWFNNHFVGKENVWEGGKPVSPFIFDNQFYKGASETKPALPVFSWVGAVKYVKKKL